MTLQPEWWLDILASYDAVSYKNVSWLIVVDRISKFLKAAKKCSRQNVLVPRHLSDGGNNLKSPRGCAVHNAWKWQKDQERNRKSELEREGDEEDKWTKKPQWQQSERRSRVKREQQEVRATPKMPPTEETYDPA